MSEKAPPLKKGWMRKQGRSGLVKNWKTRFFVLGEGKIAYYVNESNDAPYGEGLKGELTLVNSEVVEEHTRNINDKQIFIVSYNGENNILMETETSNDAKEWVDAIKKHIEFYNRESSSRVKSMSFSSNRSSASRAGSLSEDVDAKVEVSPAGEEASPKEDANSEARRSSTMRRRVSVQSTTPMSSTSQPAAAPAGESSPDDKIFTIDVVANNVVDMVFDFCMNAESRNGLLAKIVPNFQTAGMNCTENLMDGEMGKRGEKVVITAGILMFLILFGVGNRWVFYLIQLLIRVISVLMLIVGLAIFLNSVWEMKDHFSLLLTPSTGNKVVTTGMYRIVRHPMYCGMIMIAFGWSISQQQIFKVVLSMGLFIVLNFAAEKEEEYLEKKHPKAYPMYANNKRAIIPFLY